MRPRLAGILLLLTAGLCPWLAGAQEKHGDAALPKIRLIATGGTISNRSGGRLTAEELVELLPGVDRYARAEFEQFTNVASGALTLRQWVQLAVRINELFAGDPDLSGIVVTSGTDTLEETAYFLDLTLHTDKPVVVVGSMRNPSMPGYEGAANLLAAYRVAAEPASRGKGVLVVLNDEINAAREVTKTDAHRLQTFRSGDYGVLGLVDADRVIYYRDVLKRHTARSEFDVSGVEDLPRVDVVLTYQGASGDVIKALVDLGAKGIVVAAAGAGALSGTQPEGIDYAMRKGVFIVITTRTGRGRVPARVRGATPRRLEIQGEDLEPVKARILLMLALTRTKDGGEIQRIFTEY